MLIGCSTAAHLSVPTNLEFNTDVCHPPKLNFRQFEYPVAVTLLNNMYSSKINPILNYQKPPRFISKRPDIKKDQLQLVGITALHMAGKLEVTILTIYMSPTTRISRLSLCATYCYTRITELNLIN